MTDYQPLIARAVDGLGKSTGEARRTLYERARAALVAQLRSVDPPLSESEITKERLSLEEAIRKVEADAARKSRVEARTEPRFEPRPLKTQGRVATPDAAQQTATAAPQVPPRRERFEPPPDEPAASPDAPVGDEPPKSAADAAETDVPRQGASGSARNRLLSARMPSLRQEGLRGFRDVVNEVDDLGTATAKAAQSARDTRDSYGPAAPRRSPQPEDPTPAYPSGRFEPQLDADSLRFTNEAPLQIRSLEPSVEPEDEAEFQSQTTRPRPPGLDEPEDDYGETRPPRSYRGLIKLAVVLAVLGILGAALAWQWPNISHLVAQMKTKPASHAEQTPAPEPKFNGRVPQDQSPAPAPNTSTQDNQKPPPAVAQRVVLYEEDPNDPQGRRFVGSAIWRTETVSPGPGLAPELAVRADIEIPDRRMTVTWSLRRNTDPALPASHTIEIMFNLPADFPGGGISNVPGILMKQAEQARGTPLAGLAVKVTTGFFLIGLSAVTADQQRNVQLLKDQEWFDIPIVYTNGGRAILAVEKGPPGDRAFTEAFAAWAK
jgi:hypothetical protein